MAAASSSNFNFGYPTPGPQHPTAQQVLDHVFFLSEEEWKHAREDVQFDYIVIGSGFCSYAFVSRIIEEFKSKVGRIPKILVLERGAFFLPMHFQNLSPVYTNTLGGLSETFPWTLSKQTLHGKGSEQSNHHINFNSGMVPFFGGRSSVWSAWCPTPLKEEMNGWPAETIERLYKKGGYIDSAKKLLNVKDIHEISYVKKGGGQLSPYREVHRTAKAVLDDAVKNGKIAGATRVIDAPLAVGSPDDPTFDFAKFSTPAPFLKLIEEDSNNDPTDNHNVPYLSVVCNCTVQKIEHQFGHATALHTSRGVVPIATAKLILAVGTIPTANLILNSFPLEKPLSNVGTKLSSHFITAIVARVHRKALFHDPSVLSELELGAIYLSGEDKTRLSYHIQISILSVDKPAETKARALRYMPDVVATATTQQLISSKDHVVFVMAALGELDHANPENKVVLNSGSDPTTNTTVHIYESKRDLELWDIMDQACFDSLEAMVAKTSLAVEYWHEKKAGKPLKAADGEWDTSKPSTKDRRKHNLVHESSVAWIGDDGDAPVDLDYKLKTTKNVYVTGGALWPTGASWNPTMVMCAMAQNLADILVSEEVNQNDVDKNTVNKNTVDTYALDTYPVVKKQRKSKMPHSRAQKM